MASCVRLQKRNLPCRVVQWLLFGDSHHHRQDISSMESSPTRSPTELGAELAREALPSSSWPWPWWWWSGRARRWSFRCGGRKASLLDIHSSMLVSRPPSTWTSPTTWSSARPRIVPWYLASSPVLLCFFFKAVSRGRWGAETSSATSSAQLKFRRSAVCDVILADFLLRSLSLVPQHEQVAGEGERKKTRNKGDGEQEGWERGVLLTDR